MCLVILYLRSWSYFLSQHSNTSTVRLEDTLIELYLANYTTQAANNTSDITVAPEINDIDRTYLSAAGWFKVSVLLKI